MSSYPLRLPQQISVYGPLIWGISEDQKLLSGISNCLVKISFWVECLCL